MIICRINGNREWILVQNLGGVREVEADPRNRKPTYDGYWTSSGWVPQSQHAEAMVFAQYETAKTYMNENKSLMEQTLAS